MWYIVTPFKKKCLGKVLPPQVSKHAQKMSLNPVHPFKHIFFLKYAVVFYEEE